MKRIFCFLLAAMLSIEGRHALAQTIIDISTGVDINGNLIAPGQQDDNWTMDHAGWSPPPSMPSQVWVGTGVPVPPFINPIYTGPHNPNVRWTSANINGVGDHTGNSLWMYYIHRFTFNYPLCTGGQNSCPAQIPLSSLTGIIDFKFLAADDHVFSIQVNGNSVTYPTLSNPATSLTLSFPGTFLSNGVNYLDVWVSNWGLIWGYDSYGRAISYPSHEGLEVYGTLSFKTNKSLTDINGNVKTQFCIDEDIIIDASSIGGNSYKLELYNGSSLVASSPVKAGSPNLLNVTSIFKKQNFDIPPGSYTLKLFVNSDCGWIPVSSNFVIDCCDGPNPSFNIMSTLDSKIEASSTVNGTHTWKLYSTPSVNTGPYTYIQTYNGPDFSWSGAVQGLCYYVTHTIATPDCGEACTSQAVCNLSCEDAECIISAPDPVQYDPTSKNITWTSVVNAAYYIVELVFCDPRCCDNGGNGANNSANCGDLAGPSGPGGGGVSVNSTQVKTIPVQGLNYALTPADYMLPNFDGTPCFSIKVYAVCQNGNRSGPSEVFCSNGNSPAYRTLNNNLLNNSKLNSGSSVGIFPNPAMDNVSIDIAVAADVEFTISVFDRTGTLITSFETAKTSNKKASVRWNTSTLSRGIYLVRVVTSDDQVFNKKLVIE